MAKNKTPQKDKGKSKKLARRYAEPQAAATSVPQPLQKSAQPTKQQESKKAPTQRTRKTNAVPEPLVPVEVKYHRDYGITHHHIIVEKNYDGDNIVSVGLTTKDTKGQNSTDKNYEMAHQPVKSNKPLQIRRIGTVDKENKYFGNMHGEVAEEDFINIKLAAKRAKQKHERKKRKSKTK